MAASDSTSHKRCRGCGEPKPASEFSPDKRASDGLQGRCRSCAAAAKRAKRLGDPEAHRKNQRDYYKRNRARVLALNAKSRQKNAESVKAGKRAYYARVKHSPEYRAKAIAYREVSRGRKREYDKRYSRENSSRIVDRVREWRRANPGVVREITRKYDAMRRSRIKRGDSPREVAEWLQGQAKVCFWCGMDCTDTFHVDHYYPLAKGGEHRIANLVIACPPCNFRKNAKMPEDFAAEMMAP